jgi:aldehyde:ferredoxin oxidoreductase
MELYHRGIISEKDTDGIPMKRGDEKAIFTVIEKVARQEGFGRLFKEGLAEAAKKIGRGAEEYAMVVNGVEMEPYEVRAWKSCALAIAVTDGNLGDGTPYIESGWFKMKELTEKLGEELYGSRQATVPHSYEKKGLVLWDTKNRTTADDLLGTCKWLIPVGEHKLDVPAKLFSLATGKDTTEEDLLWVAQRVMTLERACRARNGHKRDTLPKRVFEAAIPDGIYKGMKLDKDKFNKMLDEYYECRGWDKNGIPTKETFKKFNLSDEWESLNDKLKKDNPQKK